MSEEQVPYDVARVAMIKNLEINGLNGQLRELRAERDALAARVALLEGLAREMARRHVDGLTKDFDDRIRATLEPPADA